MAVLSDRALESVNEKLVGIVLHRSRRDDRIRAALQICEEIGIDKQLFIDALERKIKTDVRRDK